MKKNTKREIVAAARKLFNERGYNEVTMRDIAEQMNISVGNLTYHYHKKEALIEAVVKEQHKAYRPSEPPQDLMELNVVFKHTTEVQKNNAYYFRHYTQLAQISPEVYKIQLRVIEDFSTMLNDAFERFVEKGLMKPEEYAGQYQYLKSNVIMVKVYWAQYRQLARQIDLAQQLLPAVWSLIWPYLTEEGKAIYEKEIVSTFE